MTPKELREFNKWLQANTILGSILAIGMLAMAFAGSNSLGRSDTAMTDSAKVATTFRLVRSKLSNDGDRVSKSSGSNLILARAAFDVSVSLWPSAWIDLRRRLTLSRNTARVDRWTRFPNRQVGC